MNLERGSIPAVLFVGQAPSRTSDPRRPLSGTSGRFVAEKLLGISLADYVRRYSRVNLLDAWPGHAGPLRAPERLDATERLRLLILDPEWTLIVLLGVEAFRALGSTVKTPTWLHELRGPDKETRLLVLPHPSGLVRYWNDPGQRTNAGQILTGFVDRPFHREARP